MKFRSFDRHVAFLLLDVVPDYVEKTFHIKDGMVNTYIPIVPMGAPIPDNLKAAIIIYNASDYHAEKAAQLMDQLEDLNPGIMVVGIPVSG